MISLLGNSFLILSVFSALVVIILALIYNNSEAATIFFFLSNILLICALFLLIYAFIISDFSLRNVFLNSSTIKPLLYKIAGSWASHEGSILLYVTMLGSASSVYIKFSNYAGKSKNLQLIILSSIQILFLCFLYFTSSPFDNFKFTPNQGLGLNPVLQDKALSIHPPLLYMGYVTYIATYVNGILLMLNPKDKQNILKNNMLFSSIALVALTSGIGLGAWWAYRELGWGGYWFFDPVENISLMPWLIGIALHHFLIITNKNGKYINWSIFTSILAFLLTIYGLFFVRSGIVSSVHSFAFSEERGLYLFIICLILTLPASVIFIKNVVFKLPNINFIFIGNILWLLAFISLFVALIYPLYYSFFYEIDVAIDPEYFYKIFIPLFIPIMILAALGPYKINFGIMIDFFIALVITSIIFHYKKFSIITGSIIFTSLLLISRMLICLLVQSNYLQKPIGPRKISLIIGHFSLGLLAFSIALNALFSKELEFIGKIGDSVSSDSLSVTLSNIKFNDSDVYYRQIAEFKIKNGNNVVVLKPENRLYKIENTLSQESDIYSYLTHDVFAVLSKINGEVIHAIIYYRPMIYFIWLAVFLISLSFCINFISRWKQQ